MATEIKDYIHKKRPSLSASSLTTYASILKSLFKKVFGDGKVVFEKFNETKKVLDFLEDIPPNRRKTILSALVIITDDKNYRDKMLSDVREYNKEIQKQEKTPEQEDSWIKGGQIKDIYDALRKDAGLLMKKKQALFIKAVILNFLQTTSDIYHQNMLLKGGKTSYTRFLQQNCKKSIAN